jgi:hypothetical protein
MGSSAPGPPNFGLQQASSVNRSSFITILDRLFVIP